MGNSEDAAVVRFPAGKALVQTVDFFTPIVNDPFRFGQIAAANSLSDVYAMGGEPYAVMNIVCFPSSSMDISVLREVLRGGLLKIQEAGAMLVGGHSVQDKELKYGLSVSGTIDPDRYATNAGLVPGDVLVLTKPIGSGVLATAVKAEGDEAPGRTRRIFSPGRHASTATPGRPFSPSACARPRTSPASAWAGICWKWPRPRTAPSGLTCPQCPSWGGPGNLQGWGCCQPAAMPTGGTVMRR